MKDYCFKCGEECCKGKAFRGMVMTNEEFALAFSDVSITVRHLDDKRVQIVEDSGCPHCVDNKCSIHAIRPTMCRMFHCGKMKPDDVFDPTNATVIRLIHENIEYRKYKVRAEEEAVAWGNKHGWNFFRAKFVTLTGFAAE